MAGMTRGPVSQADAETISILRSRGVDVNAAQLERWRTAGALPRNTRRGLGRGAGSASGAPAGSVALAEALGRAARQGRPLHEAVLRVFSADPRFDLKIFLATPRLPVPEPAVRAALTWFIRHKVNSVQRRSERAVAAAPSGAEAEDIVADLTEHHYIRAYRSDWRDFNRDILTEGPRLTRQEAIGLSVMSMVSLLGQESVGAERYAEAAREAFGDSGQHQGLVDELFRFMEAVNTRRELAGQPPIGSSRPHTMDADAEAIGQVSFHAICAVRDTLALLAEAGMIYRATKSSPDDPTRLKLAEFFKSSYQAHIWTRAATPLTYTTLADSWEWMASLIVMICCDPEDLDSFEEMASRINFTLEDIRGLVRRSGEARQGRPLTDHRRRP
jgi:hypothetical protein